MSEGEIVNIFSGYVRAAYPRARKASELPFPKWWNAQMEWMKFHAPHVSEQCARQLASDIITLAKIAESAGREPEAWVVPREVRAIWEREEPKEKAPRKKACGSKKVFPQSLRGAEKRGEKPGGGRRAEKRAASEF